MGAPPNEMPPQAAQQPVKPKSGNTMAIVAIVVAVVVVVAAIGAYVMMNSGGGGSASPEGAIDSYIANAKDGDIDGALACTDVAFYNEDKYDEIKAGMEDSFDESNISEVKIINVVEISESEMNSEMLEGYAEMKASYAENFADVSDATITAFKLVNVTMKSDGETRTTPLLCVEIDGGWYLAIGAMYDYSDDDGDTDSPISGSLTYLVANSAPSTGNATFILSILTPSNPLVADIEVTILDSNGDLVTSGATATWSHLVSDTDHVQGGDRLKLAAPGRDVSGWELVISVDGYLGTVSGRVPVSEDFGTTKYMIIGTNLGEIKIELDTENAPVTVTHMIGLIESGYYSGTGSFYRAEPGFVIQGGTTTGSGDTVAWEDTGLNNAKYTISMARSGDPNSVDSSNTGSSEFFINLNANTNLDSCTYPYVVFGKVISGFNIVDQIAAMPTTSSGGVQMLNDPVEFTSVTITDA